ncbi:MAG: penicillin acylase family protein, partial [archaeon]|nr:penicillin acylase family protein [archaeon]
ESDSNSATVNITMEKMKSFQTDYYDIAAEVFVPVLLDKFEEYYPGGVSNTGPTELLNKSIDELIKWNNSLTMKYIMDKDEIAPTIFDKWLKHCQNATFRDEMIYGGLSSSFTGSLIYMSNIADALENLTYYDENSDWFDNVFTPEIEYINDTMMLALNLTIEELSSHTTYGNFDDWKWGNYHIMDVEYLLGMMPPFDYEEYSCSGSGRTLNVAGGSHVKSGPSMRMIVDFKKLVDKEINTGYFVLPGGQSGNPVSSHYKDQFQFWKDNSYYDITFARNLTDYQQYGTISSIVLFE